MMLGRPGNGAPQPNFGPQLDIFATPEKLEQEKQAMIVQYSVGPGAISKMNKKGDQWYIGNETIQDWAKTYEVLEEKVKDDIYHIN